MLRCIARVRLGLGLRLARVRVRVRVGVRVRVRVRGRVCDNSIISIKKWRRLSQRAYFVQ